MKRQIYEKVADKYQAQFCRPSETLNISEHDHQKEFRCHLFEESIKSEDSIWDRKKNGIGKYAMPIAVMPCGSGKTIEQLLWALHMNVEGLLCIFLS